MVMQMRRYPRHLTSIPFEYTLEDVVAHETEYLKNVSVGGLAFQSRVYIKEGSKIKIQIPILEPVFKVTGEIVWCKKGNEHYDVGVKFIDIKSKLHARMFEQVCFIEQYKHDILQKEGRRLTSEEAALEWINKYAKDFYE